jgi:kynureninase
MEHGTLEHARMLDQQDELSVYRSKYHFPKHNDKDCLYFCGNSLGLQPKSTRDALLAELDHWSTYGVEGHFTGDNAWMYYHKLLTPASAKLVGAKESEVVIMNTLSTNLHLLMVSFYRPTKQRFKIIMEEQAFPSDQYAVESQVKFHGFDPEDAIIEVKARPGEDYIRTEDIEATIKEHADSTALVFFSGVNYYTGQFFEMKRITECAHEAGAVAGFDLAHAAGNVVMKLHEWNVDFAAWCSYKYMNSGPGGPSGVFVHEKHGANPDLPRFAGWWGHDEESRFKMEKGFIPMKGAQGWQLSNAQVLSFAALKSSIEIFDEIGIERLRAKSLKLTSYMESLIDQIEGGDFFKIITPRVESLRGAQLSMLTKDKVGKALFDFLSEHGVICDWREPNVIRLAAVPMYNSFEDVWQFVDLVKRWIRENS